MIILPIADFTNSRTLATFTSGGATQITSTLNITGLGTNAADRIMGLRNSDGSVSQLTLGSGLVNTSQSLVTKQYSLTTNTTDVGNVGTGEDNLMTYTVPANTLVTNGDYLEFTMEIGFASNTNTKQVKVFYGATTALIIPAASTSTGGTISIHGTIIRVGAGSEKIEISWVGSSLHGTGSATYVAAAETLSGTVVLKATGEATADNDVVQRMMTVKYFSN
jgi:hypothetical protein